VCVCVMCVCYVCECVSEYGCGIVEQMCC